jgi:hypothetical protein
MPRFTGDGVMEKVKAVEVRSESAVWRQATVSYVRELEAPSAPSAFADGSPKICQQGLEEICLASTVVASG